MISVKERTRILTHVVGTMNKYTPDIDIERTVRQRYTAAAIEKEPALCCPVQYEGKYLQVLPQELIDRDYGCGNPSEHVDVGETVLDLGSGGGKICYILSQVVGPEGRVIGIDQNEEMLALARRYQKQVGDQVGWHNTSFLRGNIQDLATDWTAFQTFLAEYPIRNMADWDRACRWLEEQRDKEPLIASNSIDVVVSNCVLNLVDPADRKQMFAEIARVLRPGGRAVISDIVSDCNVPQHLKNDPALWSGCISGAFEENNLLEAFQQARFYGIEILRRQADPWAVVEGIEFRSVTVRAFKELTESDSACEHKVLYHGPWKTVVDENGQQYERGLRTNVSEKMFVMLSRSPYREQFSLISGKRDQQSNAEHDASLTVLPPDNCCGSDSSCC
ncbi:MAG: methyltransferase domain-containing protein [Planctomycetota bacterium]|nr:methyltransferase domain-containing protein [Planctomycetota bacterium]